MVRQRLRQWMGGIGMGLYLTATTGTIALSGGIRSVYAQANPSPETGSPETNSPQINCQQERQQAIDTELLARIARLRQDIEQQRWETANQVLLQILQSLQAIPDPQSRSNWVSSLIVEAGNADQALWRQVIEQSAAHDLSDQTVLVLQEAERLAQSFDRGYSFLKAKMFVAIANAYHQLDRPEQAAANLSQALQASATIRGAEFKTNGLTSIAIAYLQLGQPQPALTILSQSQTEAAAIEHPDRNRRNGALSRIGVAYAQADQTRLALEIAAEIVGTSYAQGTVLLEVTRAYLQRGDTEAAEQLAQIIPHPESQAIALAEVARQYGEEENTASAALLFAKAVQVARLLADAEYTLERVVSLYAKAQPDAALAIARGIQDPEKRSNALFEIALRYYVNEQPERATAVLEDVVAAIPQVSSDWQTFHLQDLMIQAVDLGAYELAIGLTAGLTDSYLAASRDLLLLDLVQEAIERDELEVASQAAQAIARTNPYIRSEALQRLATAYIQADQLEAALQLSEQVDPAYPLQQVQLQAAIARELFLIKGETEQASELFAQTYQQAAALATAAEQIEAWGSILLEKSNAQQPIDPEIFTQLDQATQQASDPYTGSAYLRGIAERLWAAGYFAAAMQVAVLMPDQAELNSQLLLISRAALIAEQYEVIPQTVAQMTTPEVQVRSLLELADIYLQTEQTDAALPLLAQAFQIARTISGPESRTLNFGADGSTVVEDDADRGSFLETIALKYMQLNRASEATRVAESLQDNNLRDRLKQRLQCFR
ncbi:MAG: hypothetical protein Kow00121_66090 [Elainellaceae cyanobacterium]